MDNHVYYFFSFDGVNFFVGVKVGDEVRNCLVLSYAKDPESGAIKGFLQTPLPLDLLDLHDKPILPTISVDKINMVINLKDVKDGIGLLDEYDRYIKFFYTDRFVDEAELDEIDNYGN